MCEVPWVECREATHFSALEHVATSLYLLMDCLKVGAHNVCRCITRGFDRYVNTEPLKIAREQLLLRHRKPLSSIFQNDWVFFLCKNVEPVFKDSLYLCIEGILTKDHLTFLLHYIEGHHLKSHTIEEANVSPIYALLLCKVFQHFYHLSENLESSRNFQ